MERLIASSPHPSGCKFVKAGELYLAPSINRNCIQKSGSSGSAGDPSSRTLRVRYGARTYLVRSLLTRWIRRDPVRSVASRYGENHDDIASCVFLTIQL